MDYTWLDAGRDFIVSTIVAAILAAVGGFIGRLIAEDTQRKSSS